MKTDVSEKRVTSVFKEENEPSKEPACSRWLGQLVSCSAHFDLDDGGNSFFRNVSQHTDYMVLYRRRWQQSYLKRKQHGGSTITAPPVTFPNCVKCVQLQLHALTMQSWCISAYARRKHRTLTLLIGLKEDYLQCCVLCICYKPQSIDVIGLHYHTEDTMCLG
jgi:hypothetical protein